MNVVYCVSSLSVVSVDPPKPSVGWQKCAGHWSREFYGDDAARIYECSKQNSAGMLQIELAEDGKLLSVSIVENGV